MYALAGDKNLCSDKWLASLVDAMDDVEALRGDDICRVTDFPAGLIDQLYGRNVAARRAMRVETRQFALA